MADALEILVKGVPESVDRFFDFTLREEISQENQTLSNPTVTVVEGKDDLVLGEPLVIGNRVSLNVSGGGVGVYSLRCRVETSNGKVLTLLGRLSVTLG